MIDTWWQFILVIWAGALAASLFVGVYWGIKAQYIEKHNQTRPRSIFEQKETNGEENQHSERSVRPLR